MAATSCDREGRPDRRLAHDPGAGQQGRLAQHGAVAELAIEGRRHGFVRGRERLEVLAAGMQPLVEHDHVGAGQRQGARRRQAGRSGADHQHVAGDLLRRHRGLGRQAARRRATSGYPCPPRPWSGRRAGSAGRRPSPGSRSTRPCRRTARAARPSGPGGRRRCRPPPGRRATVSPGSASISRPSKLMRTGGPAGRMSGCFRRMAKGLQWTPEVRHEEVSRHLHRPDHALHRRRQEGRRGGAAAPGRLPDRGGHPRPDPARQHRRVPERDARRAPPDRRDRGRAGGRPRAGADRHRRRMDRRGRAHQPRGRIDGRRRRDDHPALLQRADRRRALRPLQDGGRRHLDPDHGLQQPGDGQRRHDAGADRPPRRDPELPLRQGIDARSDAGARHHPAGRRPDDGVRRRAGLRIVLAGRRGLGRGVLQRHPALVGRSCSSWSPTSATWTPPWRSTGR